MLAVDLPGRVRHNIDRCNYGLNYVHGKPNDGTPQVECDTALYITSIDQVSQGPKTSVQCYCNNHGRVDHTHGIFWSLHSILKWQNLWRLGGGRRRKEEGEGGRRREKEEEEEEGEEGGGRGRKGEEGGRGRERKGEEGGGRRRKEEEGGGIHKSSNFIDMEDKSNHTEPIFL